MGLESKICCGIDAFHGVRTFAYFNWIFIFVNFSLGVILISHSSQFIEETSPIVNCTVGLNRTGRAIYVYNRPRPYYYYPYYPHRHHYYVQTSYRSKPETCAEWKIRKEGVISTCGSKYVNNLPVELKEHQFFPCGILLMISPIVAFVAAITIFGSVTSRRGCCPSLDLLNRSCVICCCWTFIFLELISITLQVIGTTMLKFNDNLCEIDTIINRGFLFGWSLVNLAYFVVQMVVVYFLTVQAAKTEYRREEVIPYMPTLGGDDYSQNFVQTTGYQPMYPPGYSPYGPQFGQNYGGFQYGQQNQNLKYAQQNSGFQYGTQNQNLQYGAQNQNLPYGPQNQNLPYGPQNQNLQYAPQNRGRIIGYEPENQNLQNIQDNSGLQYAQGSQNLQNSPEYRGPQNPPDIQNLKNVPRN